MAEWALPWVSAGSPGTGGPSLCCSAPTSLPGTLLAPFGHFCFHLHLKAFEELCSELSPSNTVSSTLAFKTTPFMLFHLKQKGSKVTPVPRLMGNILPSNVPDQGLRSISEVKQNINSEFVQRDLNPQETKRSVTSLSGQLLA